MNYLLILHIQTNQTHIVTAATMFKTATTALLSVVTAFGAVAQVSSLHASFESKPSDFTFLNKSKSDVNTSAFYKNLVPENGWYLSPGSGILDDATFEARKCALSCAWRSDGGMTENWMITPQITVTEGMRLSWEAKSLHYSLRESYRVMVSTTGLNLSDFSEIARIDNEEYFWQRRSVDLSAYAGGKIRIAFVHDSQSRFLLAVDEIDISVPSWPILVGANVGQRFFAAQEQPFVEFAVKSHGAPNTVACYEARNGSEVIGHIDAAATASADADSESPALRMDLNVNLNEPVRYNLYAIYSDGTEQFLFEDFVNKSWYRRKMVVEKFTGAWCNNCPRVTYPYHYMPTRYGKDEVVTIEIHDPNSGSADADGYRNYYTNPSVNAVCANFPALWINRSAHLENDYQPLQMNTLKEPELLPTYTDVSGLRFSRMDDGRLQVEADVRFAKDIDNTEDLIRAHFCLLEKEALQTTAQKWQSPGQDIAHAEYYFLPTTVMKGLSVMHNVVRSSTGCLVGLPGSLPSQITAGETYTVSGILDVPENIIKDMSNLLLVANVCDGSTRTYPVLNAATTDVNLVEPVISSIGLSADAVTLDEGETLALTCTLTPESSEVTVEWTSSDTSVVTVNETGLVTAVASGEATVTVTTSQGESAACTVTVRATTGVDFVQDTYPTEIYDLQGRRVVGELTALPSGIYIMKSGTSVKKIIK